MRRSPLLLGARRASAGSPLLSTTGWLPRGWPQRRSPAPLGPRQRSGRSGVWPVERRAREPSIHPQAQPSTAMRVCARTEGASSGILTDPPVICLREEETVSHLLDNTDTERHG